MFARLHPQVNIGVVRLPAAEQEQPQQQRPPFPARCRILLDATGT
jgi:hypothetical protein